MSNKPRSQKQRKIDDLSREQRRNLFNIKKDIHKSLVSISYIEDKQKNPNKVKKSDLKKGDNNNLGVEGIHSVNSFETYQDRLNTIATYCVRHFNLQSLAKLKPYMIENFFSQALTLYEIKSLSAKTVKNYLNAVLKLQEAGHTRNIKSLQNLISEEMRDLIADIQYSKKDYKRGALKEGYSYEEAKIIERKIAILYGEEFRLMVRVLIEAATRLAELKRVKFEDIKKDPESYTGYAIYLWHDNQCKNNRKRRVPIFEETYNDLMKLWAVLKQESKIQPNQNIWGKWSDDQIRSRVEDACVKKVFDKDTGKQVGRSVVYSGIHDFRKACIEYWDKQFVFNEKEWPKERIVAAVLWHVNFDLPDNNGKLHKPLNPYVKKYNYTVENGQTKKEIRLNEKGKPVYAPRFLEEELLEVDIRYLRNLLSSQILGHNRISVVSVYRKSEMQFRLKKDAVVKRIKRK